MERRPELVRVYITCETRTSIIFNNLRCSTLARTNAKRDMIGVAGNTMENAAKALVWLVIICQLLSIAAALRFIVVRSASNAGGRVLPFAICSAIAALALLVAFVLLERSAAGTTSPLTTAFIAAVALAFSLGGQYITGMLFRK